MDAYIEIDGKRAKLTEEQLKALGLEPEKKSPFEKGLKEKYFFIAGTGSVYERYDNKNVENEKHHSVGNYCTDKELMKQRALHETLNRLLWRYSMEHGGDEIDWSNREVEYGKYDSHKWNIVYDFDEEKWDVDNAIRWKSLGLSYFYSKEIAESAIKEIVEPFMAEHPDFKW